LKPLELLRITEVPFPIVLFLIISHPIASIAPLVFVEPSSVPRTIPIFSPRVKELNIFLSALREIIIPKSVSEIIAWSYFRTGQNCQQRLAMMSRDWKTLSFALTHIHSKV
jgi:hypothetical protein